MVLVNTLNLGDVPGRIGADASPLLLIGVLTCQGNDLIAHDVEIPGLGATERLCVKVFNALDAVRWLRRGIVIDRVHAQLLEEERFLPSNDLLVEP